MSTVADYATKQDVEEIVGRVVGEIVGDALQLIADRFDKVDKRFDDMERRFNRKFAVVEDKLDTAIARIDHHDIDIRELRRKTATL